jgi:hypothetical protein
MKTVKIYKNHETFPEMKLDLRLNEQAWAEDFPTSKVVLEPENTVNSPLYTVLPE